MARSIEKVNRIYELPNVGDRRKSFYGKAHVIESESGERFLQSYNTIVCCISKAGELVKMWDGYSPTTMRHINSFLRFFNMPGGGKPWWDKLETKEF